jgi:hypothetical protein
MRRDEMDGACNSHGGGGSLQNTGRKPERKNDLGFKGDYSKEVVKNIRISGLGPDCPFQDREQWRALV